MKRKKLTALKHSAVFLVNFHAAVISSTTKVQNVINKPNSWLGALLPVGAILKFLFRNYGQTECINGDSSTSPHQVHHWSGERLLVWSADCVTDCPVWKIKHHCRSQHSNLQEGFTQDRWNTTHCSYNLQNWNRISVSWKKRSWHSPESVRGI